MPRASTSGLAEQVPPTTHMAITEHRKDGETGGHMFARRAVESTTSSKKRAKDAKARYVKW
eukprot:4015892-Pleurochrysis_carterae.AAC.1